MMPFDDWGIWVEQSTWECEGLRRTRQYREKKNQALENKCAKLEAEVAELKAKLGEVTEGAKD